MRCRLAILAAAAAVSLAHAVPAAAAGDAASGLSLAQRWCSSCHVVAPNAPGGDSAPPFTAIAKRPTTSPGGLRVWLTDPHPPMPNPGLSRQQIDDVIAYLEQLKNAK